eukprot:3362854-Amphidinium_carterae.1
MERLSATCEQRGPTTTCTPHSHAYGDAAIMSHILYSCLRLFPEDPLVRLFKERLGEDEKVVVGRLFRGDHTRYVKRDNRQTGGLMKFIKVLLNG